MPDRHDISPDPTARSHRHHSDHAPHRHRHHHRREHPGTDRAGAGAHKRKRSVSPPPPAILPFNARPLTKNDLSLMKPLFASYLDIQKQIFLEDISEDEIKGRWKSFMGKWNYGKLAEGWYDPATKRKALESAAEIDAEAQAAPTQHRPGRDSAVESDDEGDEYGPMMPQSGAAHRPAARPAAPNFSELALRADQTAEEADTQLVALRDERKLDRREQRERLDELVPRAEPGTKERQLEKKQEKAAAVRSFRDAKSGAGEMQEIGDKDLLGDEGGGTNEVKRMKKEMDRKKTEREQRKLEVLQARAAEREERLQVHREKENKTMEMLKAIAQERFG